MLEQFDGSENQGKESTTLPFYNIESGTMKKVIEYLKNFNKFVELNTPITYENRTHESVFKADPWQITFFKELPDADLKKLAEAANFMDIPSLLDSCCAAIAIKFKEAQIAYSKEMGYTEE